MVCSFVSSGQREKGRGREVSVRSCACWPFCKCALPAQCSVLPPLSPTRPHPTQREHPDSILAANIAACCAFRTGGPAAALQCLGGLPAQLPPGGGSPGGALVLHNAVVFGDGAGGMQVCLETLPHAACSEPNLFPQQTAHLQEKRNASCRCCRRWWVWCRRPASTWPCCTAGVVSRRERWTC